VESVVTLLGRGEPTERMDLQRFAETMGGESPAQIGVREQHSLSLAKASPGDTVRVYTDISKSKDSICIDPVEASSTSSSTSSSTTSTAAAQERSSSNTSYDVDAEGQPGTVAINSDDCFDDDGPAACTEGIDIIGMAWEPVAGAPDQLKVTVTFAGPVGGTQDFLFNMGIRGMKATGLALTISWKVAKQTGTPPVPMVRSLANLSPSTAKDDS
jgi:hypothetical protein